MPASVVGTWKVQRVVARSGTACWDEARATELLQTRLTYGANSLRWKGGDVAVPETLSRTLSARKFMDEYKLELTAIGVKAGSVTELDLQHEDEDITGATTEVPGDTVWLLGPGRIVVGACGVYYLATRGR